MPSELPPGLGGYERWPGYQRLKQRLEMFLQVLQLGQRPFLHIDLVLNRQSFWTIHRIAAKDLQLVIPANKVEFEKAGHAIRLTFTPANPEAEQFLARIIPEELRRDGVYRISLWANSGGSNNVSAVYNAMILNEPHPEIYLQALGEKTYEIGLDAHGNLFDALLLSDELRFRREPEEGEEREA
jgi:hypothetical protein